MLHLALHVLVPVLVALLLDRVRWRSAAFVMIGTMLVDVDHLAAVPVYDPLRCSIGFHPLHTAVPIAAYVVMALVVGVSYRATSSRADASAVRWRALFYVSTGLVIHMALDGLDCIA